MAGSSVVSQPPIGHSFFVQIQTRHHTMHTEITTPQERQRQYAERQIIPARNEQHGKRMERDLHRLRIEYLRKLKRVKLR